MEKYSGFTDVGTGIQPFIWPVKPQKSLLIQVLMLVNGAFKAVLLVAISAAALLISLPFLLLNALGLKWISWLGMRFLVLSVFGRLFLFFTGFYWIQIQNISLRKSRDTATNSSQEEGKDKHLIITNHTSYIDILYLAFRFNPTFLHVSLDGNVRPISLLQSLSFCGSEPTSIDQSQPFDHFIKTYSATYRPIVIFPEGSTSNGRGVLQFLSIFKSKSLPSDVKLSIIGLKYVYDHYCPCFTTGSKWAHFWGLVCQFSNTLQVRILSPKDIILLEKSDSNGGIEGVLGAQISTLLASTLRQRKVAKNAIDKQEFMKYFKERESKTRKKNI